LKLPWLIRDWPIEYQEKFAERASIMEYDGNLSRSEAERQAVEDIRRTAEKE
jgi:hypothetical protein